MERQRNRSRRDCSGYYPREPCRDQSAKTTSKLSHSELTMGLRKSLTITVHAVRCESLRQLAACQLQTRVDLRFPFGPVWLTLDWSAVVRIEIDFPPQTRKVLLALFGHGFGRTLCQQEVRRMLWPQIAHVKLGPIRMNYKPAARPDWAID